MYLTMFDATAPTLFPSFDASAFDVAVAAYCDRDFAGDWIGCVHKYPELAAKQRVLSIATQFSTIARIMDYEKDNPCYGDPAGVVAWTEAMVQHGVFRPGPYADRSDMPALQAAFERSSLKREDFVLWLAAPDTDPQPYLDEGFDAVQSQWFRNYDVSVVKPGVFPALAEPARAAMTQGVLKFAGELQTESGLWVVHGMPSTGIKWGTDPRRWAAKITVTNNSGIWTPESLPFEEN